MSKSLYERVREEKINGHLRDLATIQVDQPKIDAFEGFINDLSEIGIGTQPIVSAHYANTSLFFWLTTPTQENVTNALVHFLFKNAEIVIDLRRDSVNYGYEITTEKCTFSLSLRDQKDIFTKEFLQHLLDEAKKKPFIGIDLANGSDQQTIKFATRSEVQS